jgi:dienelactone hydrolase
MVVHDWTGVQDYAKQRATQLASELGVAAFCCDIYGQGMRPTEPKDCAAQAGKFKQDRALYRRRLQLGLDAFLAQKGVDKTQVAAIGYCFGGTGVLELARSGADVKSVVSFHGGLDSPTPEDGAKIKASVLILHGADDPYVPQKDIEACLKEFNAAKVDWEMVSYSGAVHSFTKPDAGNDPRKGAAYHALADKRSWLAMRNFLAEKLKLPALARRRVVLTKEAP